MHEELPARLMRKCPYCAYYVHLEELTEEECWHCSEVTDFTQFRPVEQKAALWAERCLSTLMFRLIELPGCHWKRQRSGWVLALALPIVLFWLIAGNSLDIQPLTQAPSPLTFIEICTF